MFRALGIVSLTLLFLIAGSADGVSGRQPNDDEADLPLLDRDRNGISDGLQAIMQTESSSRRFEVLVTFSGSGAKGRSQDAAKLSKAQKEFELIPAFKASLTSDEITALSKRPGLFRIEQDKRIELTIDAANRDFGTQAARQEYGVDGTGVGICIIDTGVDANHEQLDDTGKVAGWLDLINGMPTPYDDQGHGTHVASIAAGSGTGGSSASTLRGVAPKATLYAAKVFDSSGQTQQSDVITAIEWCADEPGVDIISMSLATTEGSDGLDALSLAATAAVDAGKIVVAAAGNAGDRPGTVGSPGAAEKVITVGAAAEWSAPASAANHSNGIYLAPFSSRGPTLGSAPKVKPDIIAPGVSITAADAGTTAGYMTLSGTSMATPFAAGALALAVDAAGGTMSNAQARTLLQTTAQDRGSSGKDNDYGWGLLDGFALIAKASGDTTFEPNEFPNNIDIDGSVPDSALWRMTFDVAASDLDTPIAATVIVEGVEECSLFLFGFCILAVWDPDLTVRLTDPAGSVLATSRCQASGDCGSVGRQETAYATPTTAGTYKLEVYPVAEDPNSGKGGDFHVTLSNGTLVQAGVFTPAPLVGHWALDDGTGTLATDDSENGIHGTLVNGPAWQAGILDGALGFDGADDRVSIPGQPLNGLNDVTLALWLRTTKTGEQSLVSVAGSGNSNEMLLYLQSDTQVLFYTGQSGTSFVSWTVPSLADGFWHHLAVVRDSAIDSVTLYVDGQALNSISTTLGPLTVADNGVILGQDQDSVGGGFDTAQALAGSLDDIWLYRLPLSAQEIASLAAAAPDATPPSAPTGLNASLTGSNAALSWTAASDPQSGIQFYRVYRGTGGAKTLIAQVSGGTTAYSDPVLAGQLYYYQVSAVNSHGLEGALSNEDSVIVSALAGHWALDDGAGTTATDASDFSNHGTLVNGPTWVGGRIAGGLSFDGADDRVSLPPAALNGLDDLTLALWLRSTKPGDQALVSVATAGNDNELLLFISGNQVQFYTGESAGSRVVWNLPSLATGTWRHVAVVRDAGSDSVTLYIDGAAVSTLSTPLNPLSVGANGFVLGQEQDSVGGGFQSSQAFAGVLDDVQLHARLLTPAEVEALASPPDASPPGAPANLIATLPGGAIDLSWDAAEDPESGVSLYRVYRGTSPGAKSLLAEVPSTQTWFGDVTADEGVTYYYDVSAVNGGGVEGPHSNEASAAVVPTTSAHWALDDGSGTTASDSSGNGYDGSLVNGPSWATGRLGGALAFDGNNDRVNLPAAAINSLSNLTIAMWVNTTKTGNQGLLSGATAGNDNEVLLFLRSSTQVDFYTGQTTGSFVSWTIPSISDGAWHHLAVVRNDSADATTLYLDGAALPTQNTALNPLSVAALVLGQEQDSVGGGFSSAQAFSGRIDEIQIHGRVLSEAEIEALADPGDPTPPSAPTGLQASLNGADVDLAWAAAADEQSGVSSYRIYRDTVSGSPKTLVAEVPANLTTFSEGAPGPGTTFYYEVSAVNAEGLEGPRSNEAAASGDPPPLAAHWALDDGAGTTATDSTGHGYIGTLVNGPIWTSGLIGGALGFDGNNDRVGLPAAALNGASDVTLTLWLRTSKIGQQGLVSAANAGNDNELLLFLRSSTEVEFYTGESASSFVSWTLSSLADGQWHHLAIVRNAAADVATLYVDGVLVAGRPTMMQGLSVSTNGFVLGQEQDSVNGGYSSTQALNGILDDVRLYAAALSASEVAAVFAGQ